MEEKSLKVPPLLSHYHRLNSALHTTPRRTLIPLLSPHPKEHFEHKITPKLTNTSALYLTQMFQAVAQDNTDKVSILSSRSFCLLSYLTAAVCVLSPCVSLLLPATESHNHCMSCQVKVFVMIGVDINSKDESGASLLHKAAERGTVQPVCVCNVPYMLCNPSFC